ncbi:MAG: hypothetical protein M4D80_29695 [Myxococcota bacterium]|nr:hypothetical protein [Myxococcota bacterium]
MTLDRDAVLDTSTAGGPREADWKALHQRLRGIAKRRVALEAEEASYLVEAEETQLYRRLGYTTMIEYMERELHEGELCFSAVRELTRVATPATEEAFLRQAQGKTAHHIQEMVAGLKRGDEPDAQPDPRRITKRVVIEVSAETYAGGERGPHSTMRLTSVSPTTTSSRRFAAVPPKPPPRPTTCRGRRCRPRSRLARRASRASWKARAKLSRSTRPPPRA